jgi:hypothetical protein
VDEAIDPQARDLPLVVMLEKRLELPMLVFQEVANEAEEDTTLSIKSLVSPSFFCEGVLSYA